MRDIAASAVEKRVLNQNLKKSCYLGVRKCSRVPGAVTRCGPERCSACCRGAVGAGPRTAAAVADARVSGEDHGLVGLKEGTDSNVEFGMQALAGPFPPLCPPSAQRARGAFQFAHDFGRWASFLLQFLPVLCSVGSALERFLFAKTLGTQAFTSTNKTRIPSQCWELTPLPQEQGLKAPRSAGCGCGGKMCKNSCWDSLVCGAGRGGSCPLSRPVPSELVFSGAGLQQGAGSMVVWLWLCWGTLRPCVASLGAIGRAASYTALPGLAAALKAN